MTQYSDKLNGFWEEGYHYYIEIRNEKMTVRDYRRSIQLETTISYDANSVEDGKRTIISVDDPVLSRDGSGEPFTMIRELAYEDGELKFLYYYTIMGETLYTIKKVDHGPFDHIKIRDDEFLESLQGEWIEWRANGAKDYKMVIRGNMLEAFLMHPQPFHVVSFNYSPEKVYLVPANLTDSDFAAFTRVEVCKDMLTTYPMICDVSSPMSVFARADKIDKIPIPDEAKKKAVNVMCPPIGEG